MDFYGNRYPTNSVFPARPHFPTGTHGIKNKKMTDSSTNGHEKRNAEHSNGQGRDLAESSGGTAGRPQDEIFSYPMVNSYDSADRFLSKNISADSCDS
jgi:hypothetical protein